MTTKINRIIILLLLLTGLAAITFSVFHSKKNHQGKISLQTFQTSIGWGYKIDVNNKTYVYQPFVPVIENHTGFESKETAEKAGKIVANKILNHQSPTLTISDLIQAGVKINKN